MDIRYIDWGNDSAESDKNLLEYYVDLPILWHLLNKRKNLIVGRKGSGKSAIRKKLINSFEDDINIEIMPTESIIKSIIRDDDLKSIGSSEIFFQNVWLEYIYARIYEKLANSYSGKLVSGSKEFILNYVKAQDKYNHDLLGIFAKAIEKLKINTGQFGKFGVDIERIIKESIDTETLEFNLVQSLEDEKITIYIDDLDLGWDNSTVSNNMLFGLLYTINYLSKMNDWIHIFLFFRTDMYKILMSKTQHSDKFRDVAYINWEKENLEDLICGRIDFNYKKNSSELPIDLFTAVFPEKIGKVYTIDWMIDRTLNRPRELLQLSRLYTESLCSETPNNGTLNNVEKTYSDWKLEDICNEYMNKYPSLNKFFEKWKAVNFRINYHLRFDQLNTYISKVLDELSTEDTWLVQCKEKRNYEEIIYALYEIGFIGDFVRGGEGGSKTIYSVMDDAHKPTFKEIQIHPCFRVAVGTKKRNR